MGFTHYFIPRLVFTCQIDIYIPFSTFLCPEVHQPTTEKYKPFGMLYERTLYPTILLPLDLLLGMIRETKERRILRCTNFRSRGSP